MALIKDVTGNSDPGDATHWGGNDIMVFDNLFNDIDITPKVPKVDTNLIFRSSRLWISNPAKTFNYKIVGGAIAGDRNLNLPVLGGDDTWVFTAATQTLSNKTLDGTCVFTGLVSLSANQTFTGVNTFDEEEIWKEQGSAPSSPSAGYQKIFFDSDGLLKAKISSGATRSLETSIISSDNAKPFGAIVPRNGAVELIGLFAGANEVFNAKTYTTVSTEGLAVEYSTGAVSGNNGGIRVTNLVTMRTWNPKLWVRFAQDATGNQRFFIGFTSINGSDPAGDDPLNAASGFMVHVIAGETTLRIAKNDGSGATVRVDTGVSDDTNVHTCYLFADNANSRWGWSLDGGTISYETVDIPAATTLLTCVIHYETSSATDKKIRVFGARLNQDM